MLGLKCVLKIEDRLSERYAPRREFRSILRKLPHRFGGKWRLGSDHPGRCAKMRQSPIPSKNNCCPQRCPMRTREA